MVRCAAQHHLRRHGAMAAKAFAWRRIGIVSSSRELRLNHKAEYQGIALSESSALA
jgi:hypothetical protein